MNKSIAAQSKVMNIHHLLLGVRHLEDWTKTGNDKFRAFFLEKNGGTRDAPALVFPLPSPSPPPPPPPPHGLFVVACREAFRPETQGYCQKHVVALRVELGNSDKYPHFLGKLCSCVEIDFLPRCLMFPQIFIKRKHSSTQEVSSPK